VVAAGPVVDTVVVVAAGPVVDIAVVVAAGPVVDIAVVVAAGPVERTVAVLVEYIVAAGLVGCIVVALLLELYSFVYQLCTPA